ncbi:MAG TPA: glycosyltransferase family 4 protein [Phycisphaerae bacterium]|nr:glycosyltransferase family 4 protein [Phycisphaerae bacterium]
MKILAVTHNLTFSGAPIVLYRLLASICREHQITVTCIHESGPMGQYYEKLGIPVLSHVVASDFDVAICNTLLASNFIVQNHQHVPTVWWIHEPQFGLLYLKQKSAAAEAFELATQIVFPTRWQAQTLYRPWLKGRTILCVPNGIDLPTSRPACPFENKERFFNLVQLGTVERRKGQDLTIKAIRQLDDPGIRVFFVGTLRDKSILDVALAEIQRLVEVGSVQPESAAAYLHHCDALVFPTRDDLPSLAIMEAMWLGCCVISSDFGAIPELIEHGRTGLLFATGDSEAFAANIALIKRDAELRATLGKNAAASVREMHCFDRHRAGMLNAIEAAASSQNLA